MRGIVGRGIHLQAAGGGFQSGTVGGDADPRNADGVSMGVWGGRY